MPGRGASGHKPHCHQSQYRPCWHAFYLSTARWRGACTMCATVLTIHTATRIMFLIVTCGGKMLSQLKEVIKEVIR